MDKPSLDDRIQLGLLAAMRLSLVLAIFIFLALGNFELLLITGLALILSLLPSQLERYFQVTFPIEFTLILVGLIYGSMFLGEVGDAYEKFWWWDTLLHVSSGFIFGFIGFLLVYWPYSRGKISLPPRLLAWFSFLFAIAVGVFWEIFEFSMDQLFGLDMQRGSLRDTMWDMIVNTLGAGVVAGLGYRFVASGEGGWVVQRLLKSFIKLNPHNK